MVAKEVETARQDIEEVLKTPETASFLLERFQQFDQLREERNALEAGRASLRLPPEQARAYKERTRDLSGEMDGLHRMAQAVSLGYEPYVIPDAYYVAEFNREESFSFIRRYRNVICGLEMIVPAIGGAISAISNDQSAASIIGQGLGFGGLGMLSAIATAIVLGPGNSSLNLEFKSPIPPEVVVKYNEARGHKIFEQYLVASPDFSLFRQTRTMFADPVLVGYVPDKTNQIVSFEMTKVQSTGNERGQRQGLPGAKVVNGTGFMIAYWDLRRDRQAGGLES